jgi:hypothetical protein
MSDDDQRAAADQSTGRLMAQLSEQTSRLVRDEVALAQAELKQSATRLGVGVGLFSTAGVLALYGLGVLITVAIVALDLAMPLGLAALIVAVVLFAAAGVAALTGKNKVSQASPVPRQTVDSVKQDIAEVKESAHHDHQQ